MIPADGNYKDVKEVKKAPKWLFSDYNANNELDFQYVLTLKAPELLLKGEEYTCRFQGMHFEQNFLISQHGYEVFKVIGQKMEIWTLHYISTATGQIHVLMIITWFDWKPQNSY